MKPDHKAATALAEAYANRLEPGKSNIVTLCDAYLDLRENVHTALNKNFCAESLQALRKILEAK